jgi:S1-C subfamily serine protease
MISAITPIALPQVNAKRLEPAVVSRLRTQRFDVFQLDATAFPGNSGSPLFSADSGEVFAIVNKGLVTGTKEAALSNPTGITYAIPIRYLHDLLTRNSPP